MRIGKKQQQIVIQMNERKSVRDDMEHGGEPPGSAYRWMWERMMVVMIESSLLFGSIIFQRSREEVKPEVYVEEFGSILVLTRSAEGTT